VGKDAVLIVRIGRVWCSLVRLRLAKVSPPLTGRASLQLRPKGQVISNQQSVVIKFLFPPAHLRESLQRYKIATGLILREFGEFENATCSVLIRYIATLRGVGSSEGHFFAFKR